MEVKKTYYDNGNIKQEEQVNQEGKTHGTVKLYYENGQLRAEGEFTNGIQNDGNIVSYHENGTKARSVILKDGSFQGEFFEWHTNGVLSCQGIYKDGEVIERIIWDEDGSLKAEKIEISTNKEFKELMSNYSFDNIEEFQVDINLVKGFATREMKWYGKYEGYKYTIFGNDLCKSYDTDYYETINTFIKEVADLEIDNLFENLSFDWIDSDSWGYEKERIEWEKGTPPEIIDKVDDELLEDLFNECLSSYNDEFGDLNYTGSDHIFSIDFSFKNEGTEIKATWINSRHQGKEILYKAPKN